MKYHRKESPKCQMKNMIIEIRNTEKWSDCKNSYSHYEEFIPYRRYLGTSGILHSKEKDVARH